MADAPPSSGASSILRSNDQEEGPPPAGDHGSGGGTDNDDSVEPRAAAEVAGLSAATATATAASEKKNAAPGSSEVPAAVVPVSSGRGRRGGPPSSSRPRRRTRSHSPLPNNNNPISFLRNKKQQHMRTASSDIPYSTNIINTAGANNAAVAPPVKGPPPTLGVRRNPLVFRIGQSKDDSQVGLRRQPPATDHSNNSNDEAQQATTASQPKPPHPYKKNLGAPLNQALRRLGRAVGPPPRTPPRQTRRDVGAHAPAPTTNDAAGSDGIRRRPGRGRRRVFDDNVHESLHASEAETADQNPASSPSSSMAYYEEKSISFDANLPPPSSNNVRSSMATIETSRTEKTLVVGPMVDFLTADATLFMFLCFATAVYPTLVNWSTIREQEQVPLSCVATWLLVAFSVGHVVQICDWRATAPWRGLMGWWPLSRGSSHPRAPSRPSLIEIQHHHPAALRMREDVLQEQKRNRHSIFLGALRRSQAKIKFQAAVQQLPPVRQLWESGADTWSNLNPSRPAKYLWEKTVDPTLDRTKNTLLMQRLLKNPVYKRVQKRLGSFGSGAASGGVDADGGPEEDNGEAAPDARMGRFELPEADTLEEFVIVPMMQLRGMDVFLTDDPETEVATHPWLIGQGLRDVPTVLINVITPWANILIYLEMPSWVDALENLPVLDDDEDDVRALKNFLNGDDNYRNQRLKMIPSLVDGPLAVRVLAPPKREIVVNCGVLPVVWRKYPAEVDPRTGRKLAPTLEIELDCMSNRAMRAMAGILKRNLERLSIDVAVVVQKPDDHAENEPEACFAMWRFNHIDVSTCPTFPDRFHMDSELCQINEDANLLRSHPDVRRASTIVRMSSEEVQQLAMEQ